MEWGGAGRSMATAAEDGVGDFVMAGKMKEPESEVRGKKSL